MNPKHGSQLRGEKGGSGSWRGCIRTDAIPPTGLSLGAVCREGSRTSGRHITISCGFFIGRTQNTGRMIIQLTGFTSDPTGEINFKLKESIWWKSTKL